MPDHLDKIKSVEDLARKVHMSLRHFGRLFRCETGTTPIRWLRHLRVESAKRLLQQNSEDTNSVAQRSGFGSTRTLHRSLKEMGRA